MKQLFLIILLGITILFFFNSCDESDKKDEPIEPALTAPAIKPPPTFGTLTDIDGNVYVTVTLGTQTWMAENLKVSKYNDNTIIPKVTDNTAWGNLTTGAWCNYNNLTVNDTTYGKLYNWYAVNSGKLAPSGWHIPTDDEWTILENFLIANGGNYDGTATGNKIAKSLAAKTTWTIDITAGTIGTDLSLNNSSAFNALPGGYRNLDGLFHSINNETYWWSYTQGDNPIYAWSRILKYYIRYLHKNIEYKETGMYVRCVQN